MHGYISKLFRVKSSVRNAPDAGGEGSQRLGCSRAVEDQVAFEDIAQVNLKFALSKLKSFSILLSCWIVERKGQVAVVISPADQITALVHCPVPRPSRISLLIPHWKTDIHLDTLFFWKRGVERLVSNDIDDRRRAKHFTGKEHPFLCSVKKFWRLSLAWKVCADRTMRNRLVRLLLRALDSTFSLVSLTSSSQRQVLANNTEAPSAPIFPLPTSSSSRATGKLQPRGFPFHKSCCYSHKLRHRLRIRPLTLKAMSYWYLWMPTWLYCWLARDTRCLLCWYSIVRVTVYATIRVIKKCLIMLRSPSSLVGD